jgi:hypothetical protein
MLEYALNEAMLLLAAPRSGLVLVLLMGESRLYAGGLRAENGDGDASIGCCCCCCVLAAPSALAELRAATSARVVPSASPADRPLLSVLNEYLSGMLAPAAAAAAAAASDAGVSGCCCCWGWPADDATPAAVTNDASNELLMLLLALLLLVVS